MKINKINSTTLEIFFGKGHFVREITDELAILDIDTANIPRQVELVCILKTLWIKKMLLVRWPGAAMLGEDSSALTYDATADCGTIRLLRWDETQLPFHNREVPVELLIDASLHICGIRVFLTPTEVDAVIMRL